MEQQQKQKFMRKDPAIAENMRRVEKKRSRRKAAFVMLFIAVALVFLAVCFFVFLKVKSVEIVGNEKYSYDEIRALIPVKEGDNIYSFDTEEIKAEILRTLPYVGKVEIKRDLPKTLVVTVEEEKPYFATDLAGDAYILSSDLKVLEKRPKTAAKQVGITVLSLNSVRRCVVGETIEFVDGRTADAISEIYKELEYNYIADKIVSLDVRSRFDIYFNYENRFKVYFGDMEKADIKVRFLVGIIDELYPDSTGTIDISDSNEAAVALY